MDDTPETPAATQDLVRLLAMMYDKYENGTPCFENPDDFEGELGNAFQLTEDEETAILTVLDHYGLRTAITVQRERDAKDPH